MPDFGSALGTGLSIIGGNKSSDTLGGGAAQALALQKEMYKQNRQDNLPYMQAGQLGVNKLASYLGLDTQAPSDQQYYKSSLTPFLSGKKKGQGRTKYYLDSVTGGLTTKKPAAGQMGEAAQAIFDVDSGFKIDTAGLDAAVKSAKEQRSAGQEGSFGSLLKPFGMEDYQEDPGYQFRLQQGNQALDRMNSARGNFLSGGAIKQGLDFNSGLASQEYGNAYNRYNTDQSNIYNRLAGITGVGQTANSQVGAAGQNYANQASDYLTQQANAKAAGQANMYGSLGNLFGGSQYGGGR